MSTTPAVPYWKLRIVANRLRAEEGRVVLKLTRFEIPTEEKTALGAQLQTLRRAANLAEFADTFEQAFTLLDPELAAECRRLST